MARKQGAKDKTKRKSAILRGLGYTALTGGNPIAGIYLTHRDLKTTGQKRSMKRFAKTGAIVGAASGGAVSLLEGNPTGIPRQAISGALGGAIGGAGAHYVRRTFAKDKKKFDSGY